MRSLRRSLIVWVILIGFVAVVLHFLADAETIDNAGPIRWVIIICMSVWAIFDLIKILWSKR